MKRLIALILVLTAFLAGCGAKSSSKTASIIGLWRCTLAEADFSSEIVGYLRLNENGNAAFDYGDGYGPAGMGMVFYRGTWDMGASNQSNQLVLDLSLDCAIFDDDDSVQKRINGRYTYKIEGKSLTLTFADGAPLYYAFDDKPVRSYIFKRDDSPKEAFSLWEMSDTELIIYLGVSVKEAARYFASGMSALIDGGLSELPNGDIGRDIWLGTNRQKQFVREILYAVSNSGVIYEYDALTDSWIGVNAK